MTVESNVDLIVSFKYFRLAYANMTDVKHLENKPGEADLKPHSHGQSLMHAV